MTWILIGYLIVGAVLIGFCQGKNPATVTTLAIKTAIWPLIFLWAIGQVLKENQE